jgi:hypothetical protein
MHGFDFVTEQRLRGTIGFVTDNSKIASVTNMLMSASGAKLNRHDDPKRLSLISEMHDPTMTPTARDPTLEFRLIDHIDVSPGVG